MDVPSTIVRDNHEATLPAEVIEQMGFEAGDKLEFIFVGRQLRIVRATDIKELRGVLKGSGLSSLDPELRDRSDEV